MGLALGVLVAEHIALGLVEHNRVAGPARVFPEGGKSSNYWEGMPAEEIATLLLRQIELTCQGQAVEAIGVGFPGIINAGVIEDSPNLPQMKGHNVTVALEFLLREKGITTPVHILNDADAVAAGVAATRGHLDKLVRVWTLGVGIGFGRYPQTNDPGEGGHSVVSLDPRERFCSCGGIGHLEGIMGYRSIRLRFLDLEPEEVFEQARAGDARCDAFVRLWHRALAAATANSIHIAGPGKFFISGPTAQFIQRGLLGVYLNEMVRMSPLQGSQVEVISASDDVAIIGAAVSARRAARESGAARGG